MAIKRHQIATMYTVVSDVMIEVDGPKPGLTHDKGQKRMSCKFCIPVEEGFKSS